MGILLNLSIPVSLRCLLDAEDLPELPHAGSLRSAPTARGWGCHYELATRVLSLAPLRAQLRRESCRSSSCKTTSRKRSREERRASHPHRQRIILQACVALTPTDVPDVPPGQKGLPIPVPALPSRREVPADGPVGIRQHACITRTAAACTSPT